MFLKLAFKSLLNRKGSVLLTLCAMTISIVIMLGIDHIGKQAKRSFNTTISDVDLIVGSRSSSLNLLLYSIFRMGSATANIDWQTFENINADNKVKWSIPISLGDSHKGFRVLGTNNNYFKHYKHGASQSLNFARGKALQHVFDLVIGADVASTLGYKLGDSLTLAHGLVSTHFNQHNKQFMVTGILKPTGTPVDKTLHVSLQGLDALHLSPAEKPLITKSNTQLYRAQQEQQQYPKQQLDPSYKGQSITAVLLGLKSKFMIFSLQRQLNTNRNEPLLAIIPGVVLSDLWQTLAAVEKAMRLIIALVFVSTTLGLSAMLIASIKERYHEMQLLRIIGASPLFILAIIKIEAILISISSIGLAILLLYIGFIPAQRYFLNKYGIYTQTNIMSLIDVYWLGLIFACTLIATIPAAWVAVKRSLLSGQP
jgi:putative ABC transport system permease protein